MPSPGSFAMNEEWQPPIPYFRLQSYLEKIDPPNRAAIWQMLHDHPARLAGAAGSGHNHQAWPGGWWDHTSETLNIAFALYDLYSALRPLNFSLQDALLVLFLHDIEKPWRVNPDGQNNPALASKEQRTDFRSHLISQYNIQLSEDHHTALKYVEGVRDKDYSPQDRVMTPLAAFCHICDLTSARIWFDYPRASNDPWQGAARLLKPNTEHKPLKPIDHQKEKRMGLIQEAPPQDQSPPIKLKNHEFQTQLDQARNHEAFKTHFTQ